MLGNLFRLAFQRFHAALEEAPADQRVHRVTVGLSADCDTFAAG